MARRSDRLVRLFLDYQRLERELNLSWWQAATTGDAAAYARHELLANQIDELFLDQAVFAEVSERRSARDPDPITAREDDLLYRLCWPRQVERGLLVRMNQLSTQVEQSFATYRPRLCGREVSTNDVDHVLKNATDGGELEAAWRASKAVGACVAGPLLELVELRNVAARSLGASNYHALQLALNEQDEAEILALFTRLEALTREPFRVVKAELDERLAERCRVRTVDLRPWHYQNPFFQEAPDVFDVNLDAAFAQHDVAALAARYYQSIGLDPEPILARSDLFERDGKNPHAFAIHIDRQGDARVLLNVRPTQRWMDTMLHELGHALYDVEIDAGLPFLLRSPAHTLTTEGIAMMMGRQAYNVAWLSERALAPAGRAAACDAKLRTQELVFCRWAIVMLHFERELYRDPTQNLNELWWQLVARYQLLEPPAQQDEPAWAAKIHLVSSPVYYHNYMMGALFASQVHAAIARHLGVAPQHFSYTGCQQVGEFLIDAVFRPGARQHYDDLTRHATGSPLTADAFAAEFVAEVR